MSRVRQRWRLLRAGAVLPILFAALLGVAAPAGASSDPTDPLFTFTPEPPPPPSSPLPPPNGYLNDPCGLAFDSAGHLYIADHYHRAVDVYLAATASYQGQPLAGAGFSGDHSGPLDDPCALALGTDGALYVNDYHRSVVRFPAPWALGTGVAIDSSHSTGVAVDPVGGHVFVDDRNAISEYDSGGAFVRQIGSASLEEGYGIATDAAGRLYVADASSNTVKVYDPPADTAYPVAVIDGPPGGFHSLRDAALAVDRGSGELYVIDDLQPQRAESPAALVDVFSVTGDYEGHLKYEVVDGSPNGIAVDNSTNPTKGRVYVTSGNTHHAGVYVYPPGAATKNTPLSPTIPPAPLGGTTLSPSVPIGTAAPPPGGISCQGDACQVLPPPPSDPTLTTLLPGLGNPPVRYVRYGHRAKKHKPKKKKKHKQKHKRGHMKVQKHRRRRAPARSAARASMLSAARPTTSATAAAARTTSSTAAATLSAGGSTSAAGLLPGAAGFDATAYADGGGAATQAGSHPYSLDFTVGLDQSGGEADLRDLSIALPPGLLLDPAATSQLCSAADFGAPRASPFESSASGEDCPDRSQLGTLEATTTAGGTRRFGLFELDPAEGSAFRLGAAPFGRPIVFDAQLRSDAAGAHFALQAADVPESLGLQSLELVLWGTPADASHDTERGDCLDEADPGFPWSKCWVADPRNTPPLAFLTLPTACGDPLSFDAVVGSWQGPGSEDATALSRDSGGDPAPLADCASLGFNPTASGQLSVTKASSAAGYVFDLSDDDPGLADPRARMRSLIKKAVVELPKGVTLNPSVGAGLGVCTPAQLANETALNAPGAGCPNAARIGDFSVRTPFYTGILQGGIYLAQPDDPASAAPGAENPFDSLLAVYLIAKSADRGLLFRIPGKLTPDPGDGTITATFDDLPQLPYTDLQVNFRSGQRAPLVSPPACGAAATAITLAPWAGNATATSTGTTQIQTGVDAGPCPSGTPPFAPAVTAGGVNANVGSYTPYYVHLTRTDNQQEVTSYSLVLPKGITGKLAGIPFCPEADIDAARVNQGAAEAAAPSCPDASLVGHTLTGYGVGQALTYASGRVYLAGPYHGAPLSLVTINSATVGPFDLGTIVIRSAFQVDPLTAQLRIDSSASDPIPHIIDGIPLHLRDVRIYMDRPQFTHNPSSCVASQLDSTVGGSGANFATSADDTTAGATSFFQLLNCRTLGFRPKLGLRLRGGTRRNANPELRATFASRGAKDSNLKDMAVVIPHQMFLAQNHIRGICTRAQFESQTCPANSIYGYAVARTLLFDDPLRGNVYLRSAPGRKLPDLVASLYTGAVHIVVEGRIGPSGNGGILTKFTNLPDAPLDRFTMTLYGGKRGLLVNSANICATPPRRASRRWGRTTAARSSPPSCAASAARRRGCTTRPTSAIAADAKRGQG